MNTNIRHFDITEYKKISDKKERRRVYMREYMNNLRKIGLTYLQQNPEKAKEYKLNHYEKNKEVYLVRSKESYKKFKYNMKYRNARKISGERWRINHPEKFRIIAKSVKARIRYGGYITSKIVQMVYEDNIKRFGTLTCYLCFKSIDFGKDCLEHMNPKLGNEYSNLSVSCRRCNNRKHNKTYEEYVEFLKRCGEINA